MMQKFKRTSGSSTNTYAYLDEASTVSNLQSAACCLMADVTTSFTMNGWMNSSTSKWNAQTDDSYCKKSSDGKILYWYNSAGTALNVDSSIYYFKAIA